MINFGFFRQRNAPDHWSDDSFADHSDQWSEKSLSRVDSIDHWSEKGYARKERYRSEILIRILQKERNLNLLQPQNIISVNLAFKNKHMFYSKRTAVYTKSAILHLKSMNDSSPKIRPLNSSETEFPILKLSQISLTWFWVIFGKQSTYLNYEMPTVELREQGDQVWFL